MLPYCSFWQFSPIYWSVSVFHCLLFSASAIYCIFCIYCNILHICAQQQCLWSIWNNALWFNLIKNLPWMKNSHPIKKSDPNSAPTKYFWPKSNLRSSTRILTTAPSDRDKGGNQMVGGKCEGDHNIGRPSDARDGKSVKDSTGTNLRPKNSTKSAYFATNCNLRLNSVFALCN